MYFDFLVKSRKTPGKSHSTSVAAPHISNIPTGADMCPRRNTTSRNEQQLEKWTCQILWWCIPIQISWSISRKSNYQRKRRVPNAAAACESAHMCWSGKSSRITALMKWWKGSLEKTAVSFWIWRLTPLSRRTTLGSIIRTTGIIIPCSPTRCGSTVIPRSLILLPASHWIRVWDF